jgi:thiopeptide-type bacteriocin biosynthesis protein
VVNPENLSSSGFFALRTPLLPFDELSRWGESLHAKSHADPATRSLAWQADVQVLRARLRELVQRPEIRQALFIASPALDESLEHWVNHPDTKKGIQTERSLVRYFSRLAGRATPFGLFAGLSVGAIADDPGGQTELSIQPRRHYTPHSRLDYSYLLALAGKLELDQNIARELKYWTSPGLFRHGPVWHCLVPRLTGARISYELLRLEADRYLDAAIARGAEGACFDEYIAAVQAVEGGHISTEEATSYICDLIRSRVLASTLWPLVTGRSALDDLIEQLQKIPAASEVFHGLRAARAALSAIDAKGLGVQKSDYDTVARGLRAMAGPPDVPRLFHVDLVKPLESGLLSQSVVREVTRGIAFLARIGAPASREPDRVRVFRSAFDERYGQAWMPLLEVLDDEVGIGFGPNRRHLEDVDGRGGRPSPETSAAGRHDPFYSILTRKVLECAGTGSRELILQETDFASVTSQTGATPRAFSVLVTVAASSTGAIGSGDFSLFLQAGVGPSGATLLGRFCHADPQLEKFIRRHLREEESTDPEGTDNHVVYAEIAHLPEDKGGNIHARPCLRNYEIECFGRSGCRTEKRLPLSDLLITVRGERINLRSQRLGKRVVPRLTSAHAFNGEGCPAAYQLLGYLQYTPWATVPLFSWGPLSTLPFLPRVRQGRTIFSLARWNISPEECRRIGDASRQDRFFALQEVRAERALPRWVVMYHNGSMLPVDLDNPLSVDGFIHVVKQLGSTTLLELYPQPDELCVTGEEGHFIHELVIPFVSRDHAEPSTGARADTRALDHAPMPSPCRTFPPGSEWLDVRVYGGAATLQHTLLEVLAPLIRSSLDDSVIVEWFFEYESTPRAHLKVRCRGDASRLASQLVPGIHALLGTMVQERRLWRLDVTTYTRPLELYGGSAAMRCAEHVFRADSDALVTILRCLGHDASPDEKLLVAMIGVDRLLGDFGLSLEEKYLSIRRSGDALETELCVGAKGRHRLADRFRTLRTAIAAALEHGRVGHVSDAAAVISTAYDARSRSIGPAVAQVRDLQKTNQLTADVVDIALRHGKMHVNRMFPADTAYYELLSCDYLARHYESKRARRHDRHALDRTVPVRAC